MRRFRLEAEAMSASVASPTFAPVALDVAPVIPPVPPYPPERSVAIEISIGIATVPFVAPLTPAAWPPC
jgi:hypothetical protein